MAQPDFVPVSLRDKVRAGDPLPPAERWTATRPGELEGLRPPAGRSLGNVGPDQGFGLKLAKRFADRLELTPGEHAHDAVVGCLGVGLRRAAKFGRAPVIYDMELAFTLFGFLGGAPLDLIEFRRPFFSEVAHDYWDQRDLADLVEEDTLALTPAQVRERLGEWRTLLVPIAE
jgi:alkanesulfonate monooxygenase SsuD/methylene tetrahydromethanopterin reductase-like flavin-dependent oxidoreductase (luciferase family)